MICLFCVLLAFCRGVGRGPRPRCAKAAVGHRPAPLLTSSVGVCVCVCVCLVGCRAASITTTENFVGKADTIIIESVRTDTITVRVPIESSQVVTNDSVATVETSVAVAKAKILPSGQLVAEIKNKDTTIIATKSEHNEIRFSATSKEVKSEQKKEPNYYGWKAKLMAVAIYLAIAVAACRLFVRK